MFIHRNHCQESSSPIHNLLILYNWYYTLFNKSIAQWLDDWHIMLEVYGWSPVVCIIYAWLKKILLFKIGVKYIVTPSRRRSMGCARYSNWMMTRWTLPHPKPVPKTRTPQNGESLGRCNRTNTTSKGRLLLRCVLSGEDLSVKSLDKEMVKSSDTVKELASFAQSYHTGGYNRSTKQIGQRAGISGTNFHREAPGSSYGDHCNFYNGNLKSSLSGFSIKAVWWAILVIIPRKASGM
jgi:hypothetical protein